MKNIVIYIHGKGGNAGEGEHYKKFFPDAEIYGFDYKANTPWDAIFLEKMLAFTSIVIKDCDNILPSKDLIEIARTI